MGGDGRFKIFFRDFGKKRGIKAFSAECIIYPSQCQCQWWWWWLDRTTYYPASYHDARESVWERGGSCRGEAVQLVGSLVVRRLWDTRRTGSHITTSLSLVTSPDTRHHQCTIYRDRVSQISPQLKLFDGMKTNKNCLLVSTHHTTPHTTDKPCRQTVLQASPCRLQTHSQPSLLAELVVAMWLHSQYRVHLNQ